MMILAIVQACLATSGGSQQIPSQPAANRPGENPISVPMLAIKDTYGRLANEFGLILVDWEGQLANPAIQFFVYPPAQAAFPGNLTLSSSEARLYFDGAPQGGGVGPTGPTKSITCTSNTPQPVYVSVFPDRDGVDELHEIHLRFFDALGKQVTLDVPASVVDQDISQPLLHSVLVDYSHDESGFFLGSQEADIMKQVADDWAYFIDDMSLDPVQVGAETTFIWNWPTAFSVPGNGYWTTNSSPFQGFNLYAYGISTPLLRSGGEPSSCCFQSSSGVQLPLRRSGGVEIEIKGNFNTLGWFLSSSDDDWHVSANLGNEPNDLYSIAHHELGHALAFNSSYPEFSVGENNGEITTPAIIEYYGGPVPVDPAVDHFPGVIDPASLRGVFGNEYFGLVPARRWLITKLDLLLLEAIGYKLRNTTSLVSLSVPDSSLAVASLGLNYSDNLLAVGGIPFYDWVIVNGMMPPGLTLNRFTGVISGVPSVLGLFSFDVRVRDYGDPTGIVVSTSIDVQ